MCVVAVCVCCVWSGDCGLCVCVGVVCIVRSMCVLCECFCGVRVFFEPSGAGLPPTDKVLVCMNPGASTDFFSRPFDCFTPS